MGHFPGKDTIIKGAEERDSTKMPVTQFKSVKLAKQSWCLKNWHLSLPTAEHTPEVFYSPIFELKNYNGYDSKWRMRAQPKLCRNVPSIVVSLELVDGKRPSDGFLKIKIKRRNCFGLMTTAETNSRLPLDFVVILFRKKGSLQCPPADVIFEMSLQKIIRNQ
jgi:hypothetical protein